MPSSIIGKYTVETDLGWSVQAISWNPQKTLQILDCI